MQHYAAFYMGLHCLQKYLFSGSKKPSRVLINDSVAIIYLRNKETQQTKI